jgi:V8-like Glu-specific endopeptidase
MDTTALNFMLIGEKNHALMPRPARSFGALLQELKSVNPVLSESEWVHLVVNIRNNAMAHRTSSRMPTAEYKAACAAIKFFLGAFVLTDLLQDFEAAQHNLDFGQLEGLNRRWQEQFEVLEKANQEHFEIIEKANATTHAKLDQLQQVAQELTAALTSHTTPVLHQLTRHNLGDMKKCVVQLLVYDRDTREIIDAGSGTLISDLGHILTAAHIVMDPRTLTVFHGRANCTVLVAKYVADDTPPIVTWHARICSTENALKQFATRSSDPSKEDLKDLAVLQLSGNIACSEPPKVLGVQPVGFIAHEDNNCITGLYYLPFNATAVPKSGDTVRSLGYPADTGTPGSQRLVYAETVVTTLVDGYIKIDATNIATSGHSGSALVNSASEVVGVMSKDRNSFVHSQIRTSASGAQYSQASHMSGDGVNLSCFRQLHGQIHDEHGMPTAANLQHLQLQVRQPDMLQQVEQGLAATMGIRSVPVLPQLARHNLWMRDTGFVGREQTLSELDAALSNGAAVAVVSLSGIGGVGKTHLAREYGHRWLDGDTAVLTGDQQRSVVWVDSEGTRAHYRTSFASAVEEVFELAPLSNAGSEEAELKKRVARASKVVASTPGCLLVLDNVDSEGAIVEIVPARRLCRVLATTRVDTLQGISKQLEIDVLNEGDALRLLWSTGVDVAHSAEEQAVAKRLVERLGRLTLMVAVASRLLSVKGGPTATELLKEVEAAGALAWSTEAEECAGGHDYIFEKPTSLSVLFGTSFAQLEASGKHGTLAMQLALVLGFVAPVQVPRELVVSIVSQLSMCTADSGAVAGGGGGAGAGTLEHDAVRLTSKVLPRLGELNLVQVGANGGVTVTHRLLAEYFRHRASGHDYGQVHWCTLAARATTRAINAVDAENAQRHTEGPRVRRMCEHALAVAKYILALSQGVTKGDDETLRTDNTPKMDAVRQHLLSCVLRGLAKLHSHLPTPILHGDVKATGVLIMADGTPWIATCTVPMSADGECADVTSGCSEGRAAV